MGSRSDQLNAFSRLLDIVDNLREKCPWDREQTFQSLRHLTIEETYELGDAILENNNEEIKKELGDLLLHIIFYAKIGSEKKVFDITDIANQISEKLIRRHPHIYGNLKAYDADQVSSNWEIIKLNEGKKSVLEGVPKTLPALVKAYRVQEKASSVGFDWDDIDGVLNKVEEELEELRIELSKKKIDNIESEFGDLLFSLINYARFLKINPENALEKTNKKFMKRFKYIESGANKVGKKINELSKEEFDFFWQKAKSN
tara:strand:- start:196 stop:969 length:774 start_codon:yes stop_codon:yes gene_type:complete